MEEQYVLPADGYDHCASCNYLEPIVTTHTDDGSGPHPLCDECAKQIGAI